MTIQERFDGLDALASDFKLTRKQVVRAGWAGGGHLDHVDEQLFARWGGEVVQFFDDLYGIDSGTSKIFLDKVTSDRVPSTWEKFQLAYAVFSQKKANYEEDPNNVRFLALAAEMDDQLDVAQHFLSKGHQVQAAFTAGIVLELQIKRLCGQQDPPIEIVYDTGKTKKTDLLIHQVKASGVYDATKAAQLSCWMRMRNDAGHGNKQNGDFDEGDLQRMIDGVKAFVANHEG